MTVPLRPFVPATPQAPVSASTVQEIIDLYLHHLSSRVAAGNYSTHAFEDVERELRLFASVHGSKTIDQCRRHDLTAWLDSHPEWKSNWTRKRIVATLCRPFLWAEDEDLIASSPYRKPRNLKLPCRPRREASVAEYVALMRHASRALRRALFFLRRSGSRTCEMREVIWPEVDLGRGVIRLDEHKTDGQQQTPSPRLIGLDPCLIRFLKNLLRQRPQGSQCVFLNSRKKPWNRHSFARHLRRTADKLGLASDLSAYCVRHTYGTQAIEAGIGERQLADQMGHSTTRMVSYYAKTAGKADHLKRVAAEVQRKRRRES